MWFLAKDNVHDHVVKWADRVAMEQSGIFDTWIEYCEMYDNREQPHEFSSVDGLFYNNVSHEPIDSRKLNIIRMAVDAVTASVAGPKPKATPVPRGNSFRLAKECKKLDQFLYGAFQDLAIWDKMESVFIDAAVCGTGFLKFYTAGGKMKAERVRPFEILVDQMECLNTKTPTTMVQRKLVSKTILASKYSKNKELVERLGDEKTDVGGRGEAVYVYEAWHCPEEGKGRHVIAIDGVTILDEKWDCGFPFVVMRMNHKITGFYGSSLSEEVLPDQIRLDELEDVLTISQDLMCRPRILAEQGSKIKAGAVDNDIGKFLFYSGTKPEAVVWGGSNIELYNERSRRENSWMRRTGVSEMAATSQLPSGVRLDSSRAVREFSGSQDRRFSKVSQRFEAAHLDCARHIIRLCKDLYGSGHKVKVACVMRYKRDTMAKEIDWGAIDLADENYSLNIEASSIYNMSPSARMDWAGELVGKGAIDQGEFRMILGYGDEENILDLTSQGEVDILQTIDAIEDGQDFRSPDPMQNLMFGIKMCKLAYLRNSRLEGCPKQVLLDLELWVEQAKALLDQMAAEQQQNAPQLPAAPAGPEGGMPPLPPEGEIL